MEFRDLKKQYQVLREEMDRAVLDAMASGAYIMGPQVRELEQQLAEYVGVKHCLTCANGTDALTLALKAWGIGPGDAVFVPDFTFFSSAEVVPLEGAEPVFVDVHEETFNIDAADLERAVKAVLAEGRLRPRVVVAVDLFGLPADYQAIRAVADRYGLLVLEDGAQGFGGTVGSKRACSFGDIATTSFFPAKPLGCYGDGGAVFTDNDEWAALIASYRVLDAINEAAARYTELLQGLATPVIPAGYRSSWAQYTVRFASREERDAVQAALKAEGIPAMVYYPKPLHRQAAFADPHVGLRPPQDDKGSVRPPQDDKGTVQPLQEDMCPVATSLCERVLSLPLHPYMGLEEIETVCNAIRKALR